MIARMLRRLFTFVSALSLVLCLATTAMWVGSYWRHYSWSQILRQDIEGMGVSVGEIAWGEVHQPPGGTGIFGPVGGWKFRAMPSPAKYTPPGGLTRDWRAGGFEYCERTPPLTFRHVAVPCWSVATLFAIMPASWIRGRLIRCLAKREGLCPKCGYDLRATPDRCPECGTDAKRRPCLN